MILCHSTIEKTHNRFFLYPRTISVKKYQTLIAESSATVLVRTVTQKCLATSKTMAGENLQPTSFPDLALEDTVQTEKDNYRQVMEGKLAMLLYRLIKIRIKYKKEQSEHILEQYHRLSERLNVFLNQNKKLFYYLDQAQINYLLTTTTGKEHVVLALKKYLRTNQEI